MGRRRLVHILSKGDSMAKKKGAGTSPQPARRIAPQREPDAGQLAAAIRYLAKQVKVESAVAHLLGDEPEEQGA